MGLHFGCANPFLQHLALLFHKRPIVFSTMLLAEGEQRGLGFLRLGHCRIYKLRQCFPQHIQLRAVLPGAAFRQLDEPSEMQYIQQVQFG